LQGKNRTDGFVEMEGRFVGYEVYDPSGQKIGKVDDLFLNETDEPEYIGVKTGLLGTKSTLIPWQIVEVREDEGRMIVAADKERVKNAPAFDDDEEITPEFEAKVWQYFGLQRTAGYGEQATYGDYYGEGYKPTAGTTTASDTDELRVQRTEEELRVGTREREAGAIRVRKRVRTDRERIEVPTRREEVHVDRVPLDGETTSGAEIGDAEIRVPLTEEEVVVEKRPVAKEEVRIRKDVVEDTEVVEEDVRREEVDVEDATTTRRIDDR
jgi:uncharacterized protein (TIGR02271 family)